MVEMKPSRRTKWQKYHILPRSSIAPAFLAAGSGVDLDSTATDVAAVASSRTGSEHVRRSFLKSENDERIGAF